jgi:hypothetical protein
MKEYCKPLGQNSAVLQTFIAEFRSTASLYGRIQEYCEPLQQYEGVLQAFRAEFRSTASL